jgi:hypothetical protein
VPLGNVRLVLDVVTITAGTAAVYAAVWAVSWWIE